MINEYEITNEVNDNELFEIASKQNVDAIAKATAKAIF